MLNNLLFKGCGIFNAMQQNAGPLSFLALLLTCISTETSLLPHIFFLPKYLFTTYLTSQMFLRLLITVNRWSSITFQQS